MLAGFFAAAVVVGFGFSAAGGSPRTHVPEDAGESGRLFVRR